MKHENSKFIGQDVNLDGCVFINCHFENCTLVYNGGKAPSLINSSFEKIGFKFSGAAAETLNFITGLYHGGFKTIIEETINNIRTNPQKTDWTVH